MDAGRCDILTKGLAVPSRRRAVPRGLGIDRPGVALAAIQGLLGELAPVPEENARLAARITALEDEQASG